MFALMQSIPAKSFDAAAASAADGETFALLPQAQQVQWTTSFGSNPSAVSITIQTSLDNSVWDTIVTTTITTGASNYFQTSAVFIKAVIGSITGGSEVTVDLVSKIGIVGFTSPSSVTDGSLVIYSGTTGSKFGELAFSGDIDDVLRGDGTFGPVTLLDPTDLIEVDAVGIQTTPSSGHLDWPHMQLYERAATGVYANPQLVLADPDAGISLFVFHPYGVETLSFEPLAIFTSGSALSLRSASGGVVQITDEDTINAWSFEPSSSIMSLPADAQFLWDSGSLIKDTAGVITLDSIIDSIIFFDTGIEFSDFAIHPTSDGDGNVGLASFNFGSIHSLTYFAGAEEGITQDVTTATLVGKTMTFTNGLLTGFSV